VVVVHANFRLGVGGPRLGVGFDVGVQDVHLRRLAGVDSGHYGEGVGFVPFAAELILFVG